MLERRTNYRATNSVATPQLGRLGARAAKRKLEVPLAEAAKGAPPKKKPAMQSPKERPESCMDSDSESDPVIIHIT